MVAAMVLLSNLVSHLLLLSWSTSHVTCTPPYPKPWLLYNQTAAQTPEDLWALALSMEWGEDTDPAYTNQHPLSEAEAASTLASGQPPVTEDASPSTQTVESESEDEIPDDSSEAAEAGSEAGSVTLWEDEDNEVEIIEDVEAEPQADYLTCVDCYVPYSHENANEYNLCTDCRIQRML